MKCSLNAFRSWMSSSICCSADLLIFCIKFTINWFKRCILLWVCKFLQTPFTSDTGVSSDVICSCSWDSDNVTLSYKTSSVKLSNNNKTSDHTTLFPELSWLTVRGYSRGHHHHCSGWSSVWYWSNHRLSSPATLVLPLVPHSSPGLLHTTDDTVTGGYSVAVLKTQTHVKTVILHRYLPPDIDCSQSEFYMCLMWQEVFCLETMTGELIPEEM